MIFSGIPPLRTKNPSIAIKNGERSQKKWWECRYQDFQCDRGLSATKKREEKTENIPSSASDNGVLSVQTAHADAVNGVRSRRHLEWFLYLFTDDVVYMKDGISICDFSSIKKVFEGSLVRRRLWIEMENLVGR